MGEGSFSSQCHYTVFPMSVVPPLILASTSLYRKACLNRLRLPFECMDPGVDEHPHAHETPRVLASRLADAKAQAIARDQSESIVIAGDQVLEANGKAYGKPGNIENSRQQLSELAGQTGIFHSGMCVSHSGQTHLVLVPTTVKWRKLSTAEIEAYLNVEPSFSSAGSAQLEGLGISLIESISSPDPAAILGLPLLSLVAILRKLGVPLPSAAADLLPRKRNDAL